MVKGSALNETSTSHRQNDRDGIGTKIQSLPLMNPAQQWLSAQDLYTDQGCQIVSQGVRLVRPYFLPSITEKSMVAGGERVISSMM